MQVRRCCASRAGLPILQLELFSFGSFVERLAERFTVIRYDKPGRGLSDREGIDLSFDGQVAAALLVAAGLTNHSIAVRLSIAPRTAEAHVENIRPKLQVHSRAQIAT